jgi:hypothetical protein
MVQCIPVLRSLLRDVTSSPAASKRIRPRSDELKPNRPKFYQPSPLSRWESSQARTSRLPGSSPGVNAMNGFDFSFKNSEASSTSEVELISWNEEKELEKELYMDENGRIGILPSISEENEEGKPWKRLRV